MRSFMLPQDVSVSTWHTDDIFKNKAQEDRTGIFVPNPTATSCILCFAALIYSATEKRTWIFSLERAVLWERVL